MMLHKMFSSSFSVASVHMFIVVWFSVVTFCYNALLTKFVFVPRLWYRSVFYYCYAIFVNKIVINICSLLFLYGTLAGTLYWEREGNRMGK